MLTSYLTLLEKSITFKSISTDPDYKESCNACADRYIQLFQNHGFKTEKITWYGNPLVFAHYEVDPSAKTYLVYGHYDIQPADLHDGRSHDPFTLTATPSPSKHSGAEWTVGRGSGWGKLYARWAVDNKGQHMIHIATILDLIKERKLVYNIKFLLEGDEETGSPDIPAAISDYSLLLKADTAIISDGEIIGNHTPTMTASFRGGANMTITLKTATTDLHSGIYGNIAPSASHEAALLISKLYTTDNTIAIPGRYDDLDPISEEVKANNAKVPFDADDVWKITWIKHIIIPHGYDPVTANGLLPTIQVSGISSGYTGNGYKNIIPWAATIKINFRFGPWQNAHNEIEKFKKRVNNTLPNYIEYNIDTSDPYHAISIDTDNEDTRRAATLLSEVFSKPCIMRYCGAAVPISWLFQDILNCTVIIADLGNEDCNMHGVDENIDIACIEKGLQFSRRFFTS